MPELRSMASKRLGWDEVHLSAPCFPLVENGYGAAMGPLVCFPPTQFDPWTSLTANSQC